MRRVLRGLLSSSVLFIVAGKPLKVLRLWGFVELCWVQDVQIARSLLSTWSTLEDIDSRSTPSQLVRYALSVGRSVGDLSAFFQYKMVWSKLSPCGEVSVGKH